MDTNILPEQEIEILEKGYRRRVLIVFLRATFLLFIALSVLMLCSYIIARYKLEEALESSKAGSLSSGYAETAIAPVAINEKVAIVLGFESRPSLALRLTSFYKASSAQISLVGVSYKQKGKNNDAEEVVLTGTALNREALRSFEKEVSKLEFVAGTSVPVSAFTRDKDLSFSMNVEIKK